MSEEVLASPRDLTSELPSLDGTQKEVSSSQPLPKRKPGRPKKLLPMEPAGGRKVSPLLGDMALRARRLLRDELVRQGIEEATLPTVLQDKEIARSKKGKAGQIVVRALTGVTNSPASALARRLEHDLSEGKEDIIEKLQASGNTSQAMAKLLYLLQNKKEYGLARAIAESKTDVGVVLDCYAKGALSLKKLEVVIELYKQMPHLMRDLARHAIDKEVDCEICLGIGQVTSSTRGVQLNRPCPRCSGSGKAFASSDHKEYAVGKLLEMSDFLPKKGGGGVNVAVQVNNPAPGENLLARLSKAADQILYGEVVDVEGKEVEDGGT
jgi:hypothetical protein